MYKLENVKFMDNSTSFEIIENQLLEHKSNEFFCEILVNNKFNKKQKSVIKHVLNFSYKGHKLTEEGLKIFKEAIEPYIVIHCANCLCELELIEMASAHKRAFRCYDCFSHYGEEAVPEVNW